MVYAVCCIADVPAKVISDFLQATYDENDRANKNNALYGERHLAVIDRLGAKPFTEPTIPPVRDFSSPFKGKTPEECWHLIQEEAQRPHVEIDAKYLVVLDERTIRDSTILIVGSNMDRDIVSFRSVFGPAQGNLLAKSIVHPPIDDFVAHANEEDDKVLKK